MLIEGNSIFKTSNMLDLLLNMQYSITRRETLRIQPYMISALMSISHPFGRFVLDPKDEILQSTFSGEGRVAIGDLTRISWSSTL